jgi:hypothetical protein
MGEKKKVDVTEILGLAERCRNWMELLELGKKLHAYFKGAAADALDSNLARAGGGIIIPATMVAVLVRFLEVFLKLGDLTGIKPEVETKKAYTQKEVHDCIAEYAAWDVEWKDVAEVMLLAEPSTTVTAYQVTEEVRRRRVRRGQTADVDLRPLGIKITKDG